MSKHSLRVTCAIEFSCCCWWKLSIDMDAVIWYSFCLLLCSASPAVSKKDDLCQDSRQDLGCIQLWLSVFLNRFEDMHYIHMKLSIWLGYLGTWLVFPGSCFRFVAVSGDGQNYLWHCICLISVSPVRNFFYMLSVCR